MRVLFPTFNHTSQSEWYSMIDNVVLVRPRTCLQSVSFYWLFSFFTRKIKLRKKQQNKSLLHNRQSIVHSLKNIVNSQSIFRESHEWLCFTRYEYETKKLDHVHGKYVDTKYRISVNMQFNVKNICETHTNEKKASRHTLTKQPLRTTFVFLFLSLFLP